MMDSDESLTLDIFHEPEDSYASAPSHTFESYSLRSGQKIDLRLVGQSPLWGHHLWQAALIVSEFLEEHQDVYLNGKTVLELGAGSGLPALLAGLLGARLAVVTDYPDNNLVENLEYNVQHCVGAHQCHPLPNVVARGYLWGADPKPLLNLLTHCNASSSEGFDTLILADLLFNHSCHESLFKSVIHTLAHKQDAAALVFFTPYRPWLLRKDMAFFDLVREDGRLSVEEIGQWTMDKVMFQKDAGDETLRRTVFGFKLAWPCIS